MGYKNVTRKVGRLLEGVIKLHGLQKRNPHSGEAVGECDTNSMGYKNVTRKVGQLLEGVTQTPWVTKM